MRAFAIFCAMRFAGEIGDGRLILEQKSILESDPAELRARPGAPVFLAGNLPYAITTPILLWVDRAPAIASPVGRFSSSARLRSG